MKANEIISVFEEIWKLLKVVFNSFRLTITSYLVGISVYVFVCVCTHVHAQLCPTLGDSMNYSLPGSAVHEVVLARILYWGPFPSPGDLPNPVIKLVSFAAPALIGRFLTTAQLRKSRSEKVVKHKSICLWCIRCSSCNSKLPRQNL